ncbi:hypothetical protein HDU76_001309 [Blyttiomyces sp. JEL0837]|nr:hypothetical protein HDU76_001309 [Blyttiomyces sp. JEL0837]
MPSKSRKGNKKSGHNRQACAQHHSNTAASATVTTSSINNSSPASCGTATNKTANESTETLEATADLVTSMNAQVSSVDTKIDLSVQATPIPNLDRERIMALVTMGKNKKNNHKPAGAPSASNTNRNGSNPAASSRAQTKNAPNRVPVATATSSVDPISTNNYTDNPPATITSNEATTITAGLATTTSSIVSAPSSKVDQPTNGGYPTAVTAADSERKKGSGKKKEDKQVGVSKAHLNKADKNINSKPELGTSSTSDITTSSAPVLTDSAMSSSKASCDNTTGPSTPVVTSNNNNTDSHQVYYGERHLRLISFVSTNSEAGCDITTQSMDPASGSGKEASIPGTPLQGDDRSENVSTNSETTRDIETESTEVTSSADKEASIPRTPLHGDDHSDDHSETVSTKIETGRNIKTESTESTEVTSSSDKEVSIATTGDSNTANKQQNDDSAIDPAAQSPRSSTALLDSSDTLAQSKLGVFDLEKAILQIDAVLPRAILRELPTFK